MIGKSEMLERAIEAAEENLGGPLDEHAMSLISDVVDELWGLAQEEAEDAEGPGEPWFMRPDDSLNT